MYRNNKCGCIIFDPTKKFILISNRGHDSISVYKRENNFTLTFVDNYSTYGKTPRHFQFSPCGSFIIVANQDSNNIVSFKFNNEIGSLTFLNSKECNSPNFICMRDIIPKYIL